MMGAGIVNFVFWCITGFPALEPIVFLGGVLSTLSAAPCALI